MEGFPVGELDGVVRRALVSCIIIGALCVSAAFAVGYPLVGPGVAIGIALAVANNRVFLSSVARYSTPEGKMRRKPFGASVFVRLGVISVVAVLLVWKVRPMGWGVIGGLTLFQFTLLANALRVLLSYQRGDMEAPGA